MDIRDTDVEVMTHHHTLGISLLTGGTVLGFSVKIGPQKS